MTSKPHLNLEKEEFQVKWVGYESALNTWQPERNLASCQDLVEQYKFSRGKPEFERKSGHILKKVEKKPRKESDSEERKDIYIDDNSESEEESDRDDNIMNSYEAKKKSKKKSLSTGLKKTTDFAKRGKNEKKQMINMLDYCKLEARAEKKVKVLEMGKKDNKNYFKILTNGNVAWVEHKTLYP